MFPEWVSKRWLTEHLGFVITDDNINGAYNKYLLTYSMWAGKKIFKLRPTLKALYDYFVVKTDEYAERRKRFNDKNKRCVELNEKYAKRAELTKNLIDEVEKYDKESGVHEKIGHREYIE